MPVLKQLKDKLGCVISVDTYKSAVAQKALEFDVDIINDPSGLTFDAQLARACANADAGLVINHMRGTPETWQKLGSMKDPMGTVRSELDAAIHRADRSGMDKARIVIDPGIGFGKRKEQNSELLARLGELSALDRPVLVGVSRKSFLAQPDERDTEYAGAAAVAVTVVNGAHRSSA